MNEATIASTIDFSTLLADLRDVRDRKDALNAQLKTLNERESEAERAILNAMDIAGLNGEGQSVKSKVGSATRQIKWRANYDPARWGDVVDWCVRHGRSDLIQRRLNDSKIMELVDAGTVPDGVTVYSETQLYFRRSQP